MTDLVDLVRQGNQGRLGAQPCYQRAGGEEAEITRFAQRRDIDR